MSQQYLHSPSNNKERAMEFLRLAASGKAREAFSRHVCPEFRHHNPFFRGDGESLMAAMDENAAKNPDKVLEIQHTLQEGNLVAIHSRVTLKPGGPAVAVVHIFRFQGNHIAELWDIGQPPPENSPNEYGMF